MRRLNPLKLPWLPRQPLHYDAAAVQLVTVGPTPPPLPHEPNQYEHDRRPRYLIKATGPAGHMTLDVPPCIKLLYPEPGRIDVTVDFPNLRLMRCHWGTTRARLANMLEGVTRGWLVRLRFSGVGYRAALSTSSPTRLELKLGFINPILVDIPDGVEVTVPEPDSVELRGPDKHLLTQLAARIRSYRKPEPYNQKGVFVNDETIERKKVSKK